MQIDFRAALPDDAEKCVVLRGLTRENAFSEEQLRSIGITTESWAKSIQSGALPGYICLAGGRMVAYCFGSRDTGEIVVLAVLPDFENLGLGRELLNRMIEMLSKCGHGRLFLACSPDPGSRSHGFYRHLGWRSTGTFDERGDEILELHTT